MAGIGFQLQRILKDDSYRGLVLAYLYSALIATGPWLLSIAGLFLISLFAPLVIDRPTYSVFRTITVYTYAGTLVLTGLIQMGTTRFVADRLFVGDDQALTPCYKWTAALALPIGGVLSLLFHLGAGLTWSEALGAMVIFQAVTLTWIGMIFLSAAHDYLAIVRAYFIGHILSAGAALACAWGGGGLAGLIWGYACGQIALAALQGVRICVEFPSPKTLSSEVTGHLRLMPSLAIIGFFYNLALWTDKILFWTGPEGEVLRGWYLNSPRYDTCLFAAYISIVPAMALFLIRIETGFYKHYATFYAAITQGGDYPSIKEEKKKMIDSLRLSAVRVIRFQGGVTLALILFAPIVTGFLQMPQDYIPLFRIALLAALVQVLLLILFIILLYFDWQREVAFLAILFCILNTTFTAITLQAGSRFHGLGYLAACLISLIVALGILDRRMTVLEYETFTKHPMQG